MAFALIKNIGNGVIYKKAIYKSMMNKATINKLIIMNKIATYESVTSQTSAIVVTFNHIRIIKTVNTEIASTAMVTGESYPQQGGCLT